MPTLEAGDVTALTTSFSSLFQSLVDMFIQLAPLFVLVTGGWLILEWLKSLVRAKEESNYEKQDFEFLSTHPHSHLRPSISPRRRFRPRYHYRRRRY